MGPEPVPAMPPCLPAGTLTTTENDVFHATISKTLDEFWVTATSAGSFNFVTSTNVFTGHFAFWFGASGNMNNFVFHDIGNIKGTAPDGSTLSLHMVDHLSVSATPSGVTFNEFHTLTC
jgi:hypothetical protein